MEIAYSQNDQGPTEPSVTVSVSVDPASSETVVINSPSFLIRKKSVTIESITQITFKQIFENLINQDVKEIGGEIIEIKQNIKDYFVYLCKERIRFFIDVDSKFKLIIKDNNIELKEIPELLSLVMKAYENMRLDKELIKNENPSDILKLLFKVLVMLYISVYGNDNGPLNELLLENIMDVVKIAIELINTKTIKMSVPQKVARVFAPLIN